MSTSPAERPRIDLRKAINAVSDVVQNRPKPLRVFDQIHMKVGDMLMQSEIVADWAEGRSLAFIGDGDAISVCVAYMMHRKVLTFGPKRITVFDFDERTVNAASKFAEREGITNLDSVLYNCLDPFPVTDKYDLFYTNPPWGQWNNGDSVNLFVERGIEAIGFQGEGMVVIADDDELDWPKQVLANTQRFSRERGFYVSRMQRKLHNYHLDDNPSLQSCNLYISSLPGNEANKRGSLPASPTRLDNFYGREKKPHVRYVKEVKRVDPGNADDSEYTLDLLGESE